MVFMNQLIWHLNKLFNIHSGHSATFIQHTSNRKLSNSKIIIDNTNTNNNNNDNNGNNYILNVIFTATTTTTTINSKISTEYFATFCCHISHCEFGFEVNFAAFASVVAVAIYCWFCLRFCLLHFAWRIIWFFFLFFQHDYRPSANNNTLCCVGKRSILLLIVFLKFNCFLFEQKRL